MRRIALGLILALGVPAWADDFSKGLDPPPGTVTAAVAASTTPAPLNGRLLPTNVRSLEEDSLLRDGKKPALYAVGDTFHPGREPLILVHGINGDFGDLQPLVDRYRKDERFQLYLLAYGDKKRRTSQNGDGFADELRRLSQALGPKRNVTIVAHSMGGLVTRRALNELTAGPGGGIDELGRVRFVAIDAPWSGFAGPSDRGLPGFTMKIVAAFMPNGLEDMRAKSNMFRGEPKSDNAARRAGLFGVELPRKVQTTLVFAQHGDEALDYTEKPVTPLASELARFYTCGEAVDGDERVTNVYKALRSARTFPSFEKEVKALAASGRLDEAAVRAALERAFPRFPGDHVSVIAGEPFLAHLDRLLGR